MTPVCCTAALALACVVGVGWSGAARAENEEKSATTPSVAGEEPPYDGYQELVDQEARAALAAGHLNRAWALFQRLLDVNPNDTHALRESGRIAHAKGSHDYAQRNLARASSLAGNPPDPELHYLRGDSLLALGRIREGEQELALAASQISDPPPNRQQTLWLGRIAALRGDVAEAERWYLTVLPKSRYRPEYEEVMLLRIEAQLHNQRWGAAERLLRGLLRWRPEHSRARQMLAWVLEVRGDIDEELPMRGAIAEEWGDHPVKLVAYARALERAGDAQGALATYRRAREISNLDVMPEIERLDRRLGPEVAGGVGTYRDPTGEVAAWFLGTNIAVTPQIRLAAFVDGVATRDANSTSGTVCGLASSRGGGVFGLGASGWQDVDGAYHGAANIVFRTSTLRRAQLYARGGLQTPWRESAATFSERGTVDFVELQLYASPFTRRLVFAASGRARRLGLGGAGAQAQGPAVQWFGAVGVDFVVAVSHGVAARGEFFHDDMLWPSAVVNSFIVSYRHYEMSSDAPFGDRLGLVERSRIDEGSAVGRFVVTDHGELTVEVRGGYGYDRARAGDHWRVGSSVLFSMTPRSRLSLNLDVLTETTSGLIGRRESGSVFLHVDL